MPWPLLPSSSPLFDLLQFVRERSQGAIENPRAVCVRWPGDFAIGASVRLGDVDIIGVPTNPLERCSGRSLKSTAAAPYLAVQRLPIWHGSLALPDTPCRRGDFNAYTT
jgi:hypothetical protein